MGATELIWKLLNEDCIKTEITENKIKSKN